MDVVTFPPKTVPFAMRVLRGNLKRKRTYHEEAVARRGLACAYPRETSWSHYVCTAALASHRENTVQELTNKGQERTPGRLVCLKGNLPNGMIKGAV